MSDFKAKMHQNPKFGWGSAPDAPDPAGGAYSAPQTLLLDLRGLLLRGGEWRGWKGRRREGGDGKGREGREGKGRGVLWSPKKCLK